jgi:methyl-accepting chemotaxis protein
MRRVIFFALGLLEVGIAVVLIAFGMSLPTKAEVEQTFNSVENATQRTGDQFGFMREQVHELRRPELRELGKRLQKQSKTVATTLRKQKVDYKTVQTVSDSLGQVAAGLDDLSDTLEPDNFGKLGDGLGETATYLDTKVAPAASKTADDLDASTAVLRTNAKHLSKLLKTATPDLKAAQEIHDGLARFSEGLDKMNDTLKLGHLGAMKEGFKGLETSLNTGADQVARLSSFTYPVVTFNGLKPEIEDRKFWPEGDEIADGMRKAAEGVKSAGKELDRITTELPKLRSTLQESRKVADSTRQAMAAALKQRDQVEPLLKEIPEQASRLAEELPKLGTDLAKVLRDTASLKEVAESLRQAQKGIDTAVARWPELRTSLKGSATLLKATQEQLKQALANRREYESALRQTSLLAEAFASLLPDYLEQLEGQLAEQERSLGDLSQNMHDIGDTVPVYSRTATRMVQTARLLLYLLGPIFGLHGFYLAMSSRKPGGLIV